MEIQHKFEEQHKWNSVNGTNLPNHSETNNASFECNICLDLANDPIVTLCGHLYCWPCIYKWFDIHSPSQCPVCKAKISRTNVIPLYGRGHSKDNSKDMDVIPPRPRACGTHQEVARPTSSSGMFGEMVYARVFGNSQSLYTYTNSYDVVGSNSPRIRRHQMQADKSLSRISLFLVCCFILCFLLF